MQSNFCETLKPFENALAELMDQNEPLLAMFLYFRRRYVMKNRVSTMWNKMFIDSVTF